MKFDFWAGVYVFLLFLGLIQVGLLLRSLLQKTRLAKNMEMTLPLSPQSQVNEYVYFLGHIEHPQTRTPFKKQVCSYWSARVEAEFQTKQKSPGRGYDTHRPVLYKKSNEEEPLLFSSGKRMIHVVFENLSSTLINPERKKFTLNVPTYKEIKAVDKPKYKKYNFWETWLPVKAQVLVFGEIKSIEAHSLIISGSDDKNYPALIFRGTLVALKQRLTAKRRIAQTLIGGWMIFFCVSWLFLFRSLAVGYNIVLSVVILAIFGYIKETNKV